MKKIVKFGILAVLLVGLVSSAFAFYGKGFVNEAAREAIGAGDYEAWKEAMISQLTEERFNQLHESYTKMSEKKAEMEQKRIEIEQTMQQGYEAWKEAISDCPKGNHIAKVITEENFNKFVEMYNARQNGDFEKAKALAEELGLNGIGKGFGKGRFGHKISSE